MIFAHIATLVFTVPAVTAAVTANQLLGFDDAPCGADEAVQGVAKTDAVTGDPVAVIGIGIVELEAATAIAKGAKVYSDANGKATSVGANNSFGTATRAAAAPGDIVTVLIR